MLLTLTIHFIVETVKSSVRKGILPVSSNKDPIIIKTLSFTLVSFMIL